MKLNNVDLVKVGAFIEEVKKDKGKAIKIKRVEGEWNLDEGKIQFSATLKHTSGSTVLEADASPFMGGGGLKPDPVQYCLYGLAACFAQTFASIAAEKGVKLKHLRVAAENKVNLINPLGLGDDPTVEGVSFLVDVSSDRDEKIPEIEELAKERCPGVYCLTKPIKLEIKTEVSK